MGGAFSSCCCGERGCTLRVLDAQKTRHGFPPLWITEIVTGGLKRSKLRFLEKRIFFSIKQLNEDGTPAIGGIDRSYEGIGIIDRLTGRIEIMETETGTPAGVGKSSAEFYINLWWPTYKNATGSDFVTGDFPGSPARYYEYNFNYSAEMNGVDQIGFHLTNDQFNYNYGVPELGIPDSFYNRYYYVIDVECSNPYEDEVLQADLNDLLAMPISGEDQFGLDGVPDNSIAKVSWNENGINASLGDAAATDGVCWLDFASLTAYETPTDPALSVAIESAAEHSGTWWQNETNPALHECVFEDETTIPSMVSLTDSNYMVASLKAVRFFVPDPVCSTFSRVDSAGTVTTICQLDPVSGDHVDVFEPHAVSILNSNVERTTGFAYTSPGALTGGGCPCSVAP